MNSKNLKKSQQLAIGNARRPDQPDWTGAGSPHEVGDSLHTGEVESSEAQNRRKRCKIDGGFDQSISGRSSDSKSSSESWVGKEDYEHEPAGGSFAKTLSEQAQKIKTSIKEIGDNFQDEKWIVGRETDSGSEDKEKDRAEDQKPFDTTKTKTKVTISKPIKRDENKKWKVSKPRRQSVIKNKWSGNEKKIIKEAMDILAQFFTTRLSSSIQTTYMDLYRKLCYFEEHSGRYKNSQELVKILKSDSFRLFINGWYSIVGSNLNEKEMVAAFLTNLELLDADGVLGIRELIPNNFELKSDNTASDDNRPNKKSKVEVNEDSFGVLSSRDNSFSALSDDCDDVSQDSDNDGVIMIGDSFDELLNEETPLIPKSSKVEPSGTKDDGVAEKFIDVDLTQFKKANPFEYVDEVRNQLKFARGKDKNRLKMVFDELRLLKLQKKCKLRRYARSLKRILGSKYYSKVSHYVEQVVDAECEEREVPLPQPIPKAEKVEIELVKSCENYGDLIADFKTKKRLPKEFRFKKGTDVVVGKLVVGNESLLNDQLKSNGCQLLYMCEGFSFASGSLKPWYDEDQDGPYTPTPIMLNALTLLNLAGSRWTHRDLIGISSLLCENRENSAPMPFMDKLNLNKAHTIRILDTILGEDSVGVPYEPQPIPCYNSTFQVAKVDIRGVVIMDRDYAQLTRAYALLDMPNADHFIFPITMQELRKAAQKRTACKLNEKAFHLHESSIQEWVSKFCRIGGRPFQDVEPDDFLDYAREAIHRKGLNGSSAMEFMAAANFAANLLEKDPSGEELCKLFHYELLEETSCFIKDEEYDKLSTTLRFIVSPDNFVKIVHGAVFRPIEEKTYFSSKSPFYGHLIKGLDADAVKRKFNEIPRKEGYVFLQGDVSAFESSQSSVLLRYEEQIAQSYYQENTVAHKLQSILYDFMCGDKILKNRNWRLLLHDQRLSGFLTTSWGNAIMNFLNICAVCGIDPEDCHLILEGDDFILYLPKELADKLVEESMFPLTYDIADSWDELSFCGYHLNHRNMFSPADRNSLLRKFCTYFVGNGISRRKAYSLLYLRALSYQFKYGDIPDMDFLINEINTQYADIRHLGVLKSEIDRWYRENWWYLENRLKDFKLPKDTSKVPYFADIYHRLIELAEQKGEVLNSEHKVKYYNDALKLSLSRDKPGFWSKVAKVAVFGPLHLVRRMCGKVKNHYDLEGLSGTIDEWALDCLSSDKIRRFVLRTGCSALLPAQEYRSHRGTDGYDGSINECDSKLTQHYNDTYKHYCKSYNKCSHYNFTVAEFFKFDHRTLDLIQSILDSDPDATTYPRIA